MTIKILSVREFFELLDRLWFSFSYFMLELAKSLKFEKCRFLSVLSIWNYRNLHKFLGTIPFANLTALEIAATDLGVDRIQKILLALPQVCTCSYYLGFCFLKSS